MAAKQRIGRAVGVALVAVALLGLGPIDSARAAVPVLVLVLDGTGYGHGVGLSQWGAEYMARQGQTADQILTTFYPGAALGQAGGLVRVAVHKPATSATTVSFPQGGEVRSALEGQQASGFPVRVGPGGRVRITYDGSYRVEALVSGRSAGSATGYRDDPCPLGLCPPTTPPPPAASTTTTTTTPSPTQPPTTAPPGPGSGGGTGGTGGADGSSPPPTAGPSDPQSSSGSPVWAVPAQSGLITVDERGRSYRGVIEATGGGALRLVNQLGVEDYLRGMQEVPGAWPAAAVQAQTIAARTYALRAMGSGGELCDDQRCQVYVGRSAESSGQDAAVARTASRVLTFNRALAAAVYSADAGGVSATTLEGFGTPDRVYPYLTTVRYDTDNPLPWHLEVALTDIASRMGYPGDVTSVRVGTTGPSGRAMDLILEGTVGEVAIDGRRFASSLGLRSTRFELRIGSSDGAPPPPPDAGEAIQALPDDAAAIAQRPVRPTRPTIERRDRGAARVDLRDADVLGRTLSLVAALALAAATGAMVPVGLAHPQLPRRALDRLRRARSSPSD